MFLPFLLAWIIQGNFFTGERVLTRYTIVLVIVASLAGQGEIIRSICPAMATRNDMFNRKCLRCKLRLAFAILTTSMRPGYDLTSKF